MRAAKISEVGRRPLLIILMLIYAFNSVDGITIGIVLQSIKLDLHLSDTQLGFLTGLAFALFYALMGIPMAKWADRGDRVLLISFTTALWSAAVAACALAANFVQLLLIRVCVGIGESGCVPPAHSLIADYYPRSERPRAISRYMLGGPLAYTLGYFAAGWFNLYYGWRATFFALGLPGFFLAGLAWLILKEPRRSTSSAPIAAKELAGKEEPTSTMSLWDVCRVLFSSPAFRNLLVAISVWYFFGYGLQQWQPTFFIRSHKLNTGEIGTWFALIYGLGGAIGMYLGGELASRYAVSNERLQLRAGAIAFIVFGGVTALAFEVTNEYLAFACLAVATIGGCMAQGPMFATIQTLVPSTMRARAIAIIYLFSNLVGWGLGPLAAGALSDYLKQFLGEESLRYSLIVLCPGYFWAAFHLWRASAAIGNDMGRLNTDDTERPLLSGLPQQSGGRL